LKSTGGVVAAVTRFGQFGLENASTTDPGSAALSGLVKTAGHEWPGVRCKVIDIEPDVAADSIIDELLSTGPVEVALVAGGRFGVDTFASEQPGKVDPLPMEPGELVVVTGGARGVTAHTAMALASAYRPTLLILGRTPAPTPEPPWLAAAADLPAVRRAVLAQPNRPTTPKDVERACQAVLAARELRDNLHRFERAGASVGYHAVDVTDATAVARAVSQARAEHGPVRGIIHGAGVLADRRIEDKTRAQLEAVYRPKVLGLRSMLEATASDPLRFIALFSSSTARFGRAGQCDYAAANEVLNAMARQQRYARPGCRVVSLNWGPWDGGMVTPGLRTLFESEGVGVIPLSDGARFVVAELSAPAGPSDVVVLGPPPPVELTLTDTHPVLRDHVIAGRAVVPVALALEWMADAAARTCPGRQLIGCANLRVLRPITVGPTPTRIRITSEPRTADERSVFDVSIALADGGPAATAYRGEFAFACDLEPAHTGNPSVGESRPLSIDRVYAEYLFHGPALRGIQSARRIAADAIEVECTVAPAPADWAVANFPPRWHADPLVIDCALQALIIWCRESHGVPCLPTAWKRLHLFRTHFGPAPVRITARVVADTASIVRADLEIYDARGAPMAKIQGCEMVRSDNLDSAFRANRLPAVTA